MTAYYINERGKLGVVSHREENGVAGFSISENHLVIAIKDENGEFVVPEKLALTDFETLFLNTHKASQALQYVNRSEFMPAGYRVAGKAYLPETIAYRERVFADGGTIEDLDYIETIYKVLKQNNLLDSIGLFHYKGGMKKDSAGAISKLYSLDNSGNDVIQTIGSAQPKYTLNGIEFVSGNYLHAHGNSVFSIDSTVPLSHGAEFSVPDLLNHRAVYSNMNSTSIHEGFDLYAITDGRIANHLVKTWPSDAIKVTSGIAIYTSNAFINHTSVYDGSKTANGINQYDAGTLLSKTIDNDTLTSNVLGQAYFTIGGRWNVDTGLVTNFNGLIKKQYVFKQKLTGAQLTELAKL